MVEHQDKRRTDMRNRIVQEALALYLTGGYEQIHLQDIAHRLHVSRAALFYHFPSKQHLFFAVLLRLLEKIHQRLTEALTQCGDSVYEQLKAALHALIQSPPFDIMRYLREEASILTSEQQQQVQQGCDQFLLAIISAILETGIKRGEVRPHDVNRSSTLLLQTALLLAHQKRPPQSRPSVDVEREAEAMLSLLWHGFASPSQEVLQH